MPSVGMRRNTRVFGARVLRSGRKLWTGGAGVRKHIRAGDGEDWIGLLDDSVNGGGDVAIQSKENGFLHGDIALKEENVDFDNDNEAEEEQEDTREPDGDGDIGLMGLSDKECVDKMWGAVYKRKRKRISHTKGSNSSGDLREQRSADRMYGKQFYRKHCRKRIRSNPIEVNDSNSDFGLVCGLIVESSCGSSWFSCFLNSVLRYMRRFRVRMDQLSAFLSSEPINHVFSSHGIRLLQDSSSFKSHGVCKLYDSRCSMPLFTVHFSAVPSSFMYLHSTLRLKSASRSNILLEYMESPKANTDQMIDDDDDQPSYTPCEEVQSVNIAETFDNAYSKRNVISIPKLPGKTLQLRNGVTSRCIQKKRRSALRSKRGNNKKYSAFGIRTAKRALVTDLFLDQEGRIPFSPLPSNRVISTPVQKSLRTNVKDLKSSALGLTNDLDSTSCLANILVIESDKGYREEGAVIKLGTSCKDQWFLSVSRDGEMIYNLKPQTVMRPYSCNRFTHAIIWKDEGSNGCWMLEFFSRQDWLVFKELHRLCFDRNLRAPQVDIIPVPVVREVSGYADDVSIAFERPDSYISWKDDEVARALANGTVNYDLDFDDEEWLNKFNNEFCAGDGVDKFVSADTFEKIIFAFEKGLYCSPDEYSDPKSAADLCVDLERREVLEAVHSYWLRKRKQKRSALVRVFQCYQPRRAQLLPRAVLRKKRSSKRLARRTGRGKRHTFLKAMLAEQNNPVDKETSLLKVQEAKAAASRSEDGAILKRQKAQLLMQTAELATYKATMALRIAEAAQVSESPEDAASFFFLD